MLEDDAISISSGDEPSAQVDTAAVLKPVVQRVVDALGGYEGPENAYRLGDSASACLSDLKKLWRKDDTDDDRTVARIFYSTLVLPNDLVPILIATAGQGHVEDPRALKCADLMCAMTWPIDIAEELKELDDELDRGTDYTELVMSHLTYKAALLKPGVMQALFGIALPPLARPQKERTQKDIQVVNVVLHIVRNLAFIKDPAANIHLSADHAEYAGLQGRLVRVLEETHILELLLTIAANEGGDKMFEGWNTVVLEIFYLLFRGVSPAGLTIDQAKQPTANLQRLLAAEEQSRRDIARKAASRHSRFGTTVSVRLNSAASAAAPGSSQSFVLHRQQALTGATGSVMDLTKKAKSKKSARRDELGREDNLGLDARRILQGLAKEFIRSCFNPFLAGLLKDIKSERPKITEKDNLRLLFVTKWFLEFFLAGRERKGGDWDFGFGHIAEVTERSWIVWVLKRMRGAVEDKPKQWTELQAGIECLTQLLALIDAMSTLAASEPEPDTPEYELVEAARTLQQQLIYNGEVLDIAFDSLRVYKEGTQSLVFLDASVKLAFGMFKSVQQAGKDEMYVRKKKAKRRRAKRIDEDGDVPEDEGEEEEKEEDIVHETMFTFEAFEMKFANADITHTLLTYLSRYKEFDGPEAMKRVVNLIHRQAVRAKAEGLFFNASTLDLFRSILADQKSLPRDQPYRDLINLINFILRKFFKALEEEPFLAVETFFPKNRSHWKAYSSYKPEEKIKQDRTVEDNRFPQDVQVKKGYSWSEQLGIAIQALVEDGKVELINWVKDILTLVIGLRQRIIDETDTKNDDDVVDVDSGLLGDGQRPSGPSSEAMSKFTDYLIPYISDEQADAATKNAQLKLVFRLVKFYILDEDADELEWYVPAAIVPREMQSCLVVIDQYLENPIDLEGKKAAQLLSKKARRRRTRRRSSTPDSDADAVLSDEDEPKRKKKKEKKKKEKEIYKSAQFIEDSDEEYGDMEAFLEKERIMREKAALEAAKSGKSGTMKATGTKKRRKKAGTNENGAGRKKRRGSPDVVVVAADDDEKSDESDVNIFGSPKAATSPILEPESRPRSHPRPRPKPRPKTHASSEAPSPRSSSPGREPSMPIAVSDEEDNSRHSTEHTEDLIPVKRKGRLLLADSDEE
ncbi:hypothetical protein PLICRDRAFT_38697 [Plicaturopsis crispa FD-325 SS-3]|nr:hypothetical protein PLICRDRAFT_38697 [Plicaturopsis crispa FD-325 SS-3]